MMTAQSHLSPCCRAFSVHRIIDAPGKWRDIVASVGVKTENNKKSEKSFRCNMPHHTNYATQATRILGHVGGDKI